ncbi:hypothetical protein KL905_003245 [Ogataea polymorpha]|nr:hypothetical protein KL937_003117 [Ogataea polymorpha]KAG7909196.1 hypothetical protein KL906_002690 [Ogataea polymorpha]KAG7920611.1 hypothetical protein KL905_003245 [Ogataea polymorpha]KAG7934964.1 hypothetical protein KL904_003296 [Ogataea polymorpha]
MSLFEVDGWGLEGKKVAEAVPKPKPVKENNVTEKKGKRVKQKNQKKGSKVHHAKQKDYDISTAASADDSKPKHSQQNPSKVSQDTTNLSLTPLQRKMMAKLAGSRFRWINEQLYTIKSDEALKLIQEQPELFEEYHEGFRSQVQSWPENPVDVFVNQIKTRATTRHVNAPGGLPGLANSRVVIADMGCGEAQLAQDVKKFMPSLKKKKIKIDVHSFDLKKANSFVTVADIKNVPLADASCTIVVFCLALMGTNFLDFIAEAYRLLAPRGELWIAEIKSRFSDEKGTEFIEALKSFGFFHKSTDDSNKMFTRFEFFKPPEDILAERRAKEDKKRKFVEKENKLEALETKRQKRPEGEWLLKPCIYKRR